KVLLPPATLEELEDVTTENLLDILDGVRRRFDYTVVDIWHTVEDATLAIMEAADQLLLVTTPEAPAIDSLRRFLGMVKDQPHLRPKMKLVVNRYPSSGGLDLGEIENRLGLHSVATVPSDGEGINVAINVGLSVGQKTIAGVSGPKLRALAEALALPADLGPAPSSSTPAPRWRFSLHRPPRDDARGA
ncbi:MAG TPA: hypothetical protein VM536_04265, partial [Chloroflexia bacterium]|nr:hypothetical protein [Chloroflexia bacterium]